MGAFPRNCSCLSLDEEVWKDNWGIGENQGKKKAKPRKSERMSDNFTLSRKSENASSCLDTKVMLEALPGCNNQALNDNIISR